VFVCSGRFVKHVYSQLKADIESQNRGTDGEHLTVSGNELSAKDSMCQLFVKHRNEESAFFCDLGESLLLRRKVI